MAYPFVRSHVDLGRASGPRLAIAWHFAEGGGTVGFLSRPNTHGVSVHFVIERTGRIVQMLLLTHMHTSIRPSAIRVTDDPPYDWHGTPIVYGVSAAKAVMRTWHNNPNNASIGVEIEGFARDGPNPAQAVSIEALWRDMASRFPGIRSLGHRDWQSYKQCPGHKLPWDRVGGHGPKVSDTQGDDVPLVKFTPGADVSGSVTVKADTLVIPIEGGERPTVKAGITRPALGMFTLDDLDDRPCYLLGVGAQLCFIGADDVTFTANDADCTDAVAAAITTDRAKARVVWA